VGRRFGGEAPERERAKALLKGKRLSSASGSKPERERTKAPTVGKRQAAATRGRGWRQRRAVTAAQAGADGQWRPGRVCGVGARAGGAAETHALTRTPEAAPRRRRRCRAVWLRARACCGAPLSVSPSLGPHLHLPVLVHLRTAPQQIPRPSHPTHPPQRPSHTPPRRTHRHGRRRRSHATPALVTRHRRRRRQTLIRQRRRSRPRDARQPRLRVGAGRGWREGTSGGPCGQCTKGASGGPCRQCTKGASGGPCRVRAAVTAARDGLELSRACAARLCAAAAACSVRL
jgi:hypothetical protein